MSYIPRDASVQRRSHLRTVEPTRAIARPQSAGLPELLFTSLTAAVFLLLMAAVAAAAILYSRGA
ncbi:MAG TPA: hypothetical protein VH353_04960 [Caulobacteraceae bacterium]|jgi:hypothetical protein|nr:hypothetical protein [Caulobacteraceae bacterium]